MKTYKDYVIEAETNKEIKVHFKQNELLVKQNFFYVYSKNPPSKNAADSSDYAPSSSPNDIAKLAINVSNTSEAVYYVLSVLNSAKANINDIAKILNANPEIKYDTWKAYKDVYSSYSSFNGPVSGSNKAIIMNVEILVVSVATEKGTMYLAIFADEYDNTNSKIPPYPNYKPASYKPKQKTSKEESFLNPNKTIAEHLKDKKCELIILDKPIISCSRSYVRANELEFYDLVNNDDPSYSERAVENAIINSKANENDLVKNLNSCKEIIGQKGWKLYYKNPKNCLVIGLERIVGLTKKVGNFSRNLIHDNYFINIISKDYYS